MKINDNNEEYSGQPKVMQKNVDSKEAAVGAGEGGSYPWVWRKGQEIQLSRVR